MPENKPMAEQLLGAIREGQKKVAESAKAVAPEGFMGDFARGLKAISEQITKTKASK